MARIDEWGWTGALAALGALSYAGGKTLAKEVNTVGFLRDSILQGHKKPLVAFAKQYPKVFKTAGLAGMAVGAAGLAWCIFDEIHDKKEGKLA